MAIGKAVLNFQVDEATLDNVDVYMLLDVSHQVDLLIGRAWCDAPEISYVKYENTLTYYNTIAFLFITTSATSNDSTTDRLLSREIKRLEAQKITLVTAMVSGREIQVPVRNQTEQEIEIRANEVIARRISFVQAPQVKPEQ